MTEENFYDSRKGYGTRRRGSSVRLRRRRFSLLFEDFFYDKWRIVIVRGTARGEEEVLFCYIRGDATNTDDEESDSSHESLGTVVEIGLHGRGALSATR